MNTAILLVMHGAPPSDFPRPEMGEFFSLHGRLEGAHGPEQAGLEKRYAELDAKMRHWPRTLENDPFYFGSQELVAHLEKAAGLPVLLSFNEFCAPTIETAISQAAAQGVEKLIVITPMMTRGGEHSEHDIPAAIRQAQARFPQLEIKYLWPFETSQVARFLSDQVASWL